MHTRVKTAKGRRVGSTRWLERQLNDPYVQRAKREGWRARSIYKLEEIDAQFRLLRKGARVLDLGAAPGSWSQYAARRGARVVAVDLLPVDPIGGVELVQGDFLDPEVQAELVRRLAGPADLVLSDMAPAATGQRAVDRLRAEGIGEAVLDFAARVLRPGGACLLKLVKGAEAPLVARAKGEFRSTRLLRPKATRSDSSEIFLLALERQPRP
ncbi:MAG TPA: RlmE family RNA methyltransferase [Geminicoccaceae bacterium]|nr:RlmE family RNA methyltransferase [Geminicoccaceae bacterium]